MPKITATVVGIEFVEGDRGDDGEIVRKPGTYVTVRIEGEDKNAWRAGTVSIQYEDEISN